MIAILDYGMGNLFSIYNGLKKVIYEYPILVTANNAREELKDADGIIVPGVGAFDDGMRNLKPFSEVLCECADSGVPVLGICLGMQALFDNSEEGGERGLRLIPGSVVCLSESVRVPHMGWNNLHLRKESELLEGVTGADYFYFVHSYYCVPLHEDRIVASVEYGGDLAAVVSKGSLYGVQFHPEKSSIKGLRILANFARMCKR